MLDAHAISLMKPDAIVVNTARGAVVDTVALAEALNAGKLWGAGIDVFENEPLPEESSLWRLPNVVVSPHNSFVSNGNATRMFTLLYENLKNFIGKSHEEIPARFA